MLHSLSENTQLRGEIEELLETLELRDETVKQLQDQVTALDAKGSAVGLPGASVGGMCPLHTPPPSLRPAPSHAS